jgi:hypothetical protein
MAADRDDDVTEEAEESSFLDMSDEDIMNYDPSKLEADDEEDSDEEEVDDGEQEEDAEPDAADDESDPEDDDASADPAVEDAPEAETKVLEGELNPIDYKAEYERLTTSFKANGKDIAVTSVDEAISLMQMGANYNKKMAALKPNLKLLKLLENNKLLDEAKLSYLIDLDKKDPAAITKLIKDSGIDPLDVDVDKDSEYKPKTYTVDDRELELDEVLGELQDTATYSQTLDIVGNKWDGPSKQVVADNPQVLRIVNDHVARGIYPIISKEIERERMLGRLKGMSDLQAYQLVGDAIQARGGFNHLIPNAPPVKVAPPVKKLVNQDLVSKKRAASSTQKAAPSSAPADFNPLGMSDEEFEKLVVPKFL